MGHKKITIVISLIIFRVLLDCIYCGIISPAYSYAGLKIDFSVPGLIISWLMMSIFINLFLRLIENKKCGAIIIGLLIICSAIPTSLIAAYVNHDLLFATLNTVYWLILYVLYTKIRFKFKVKIGGAKWIRSKSNILLTVVFLLFSLVDLYICIRYTNFHFSLNLYDVYETRAAFSAYDIPSVLIYLFSASTIIFPIFLVYSLRDKRYAVAFISALFQLIAFSIDGRKSTLFILFITLAGYYFPKWIDLKNIPSAVSALTFLGLLEHVIFKTATLIDLFIRRLFILPAYLNHAYYSFFLTMPKDFFRQSVLGKIGIVSEYADKIPIIIGDNYYLHSYANNGLFSDAYCNFGVIGIIILPLMLALVLRLLDYCTKGLSIRCCLGVVLVSAYTLLSSSFFTVMLTHGFLIGCLTMWSIPRDKVHEK